MSRLATFIAFAIVMVTFGMIGIWTADRTVPVEVIQRTVLTPEVEPGGELVIKRTVYRTKQCDTTVDRFFVDSQGFRYVLEDQRFATYGQLGEDTFTISTPIPLQMAKGPAQYWGAASYRCNPIQEFWPVRHTSAPLEFVVR